MSQQVGIALYTASSWVIPLVIAITFHEASHGYFARLCGDDSNANDFIFQKQGGSETLVAVEEDGRSYRASLVIGIDRTRSGAASISPFCLECERFSRRMRSMFAFPTTACGKGGGLTARAM